MGSCLFPDRLKSLYFESDEIQRTPVPVLQPLPVYTITVVYLLMILRLIKVVDLVVLIVYNYFKFCYCHTF